MRKAPGAEAGSMNTLPLLSELHAHTTWSDGSMSVRELVDLHGRAGFAVLAVTDHAPGGIDAANYDRYLLEIATEAARALTRYGLLVLPGLELTFEDPDPVQSGHAVAVGLRSLPPLDGGLEKALVAAREAGAALIAAHPYTPDQAADAPRRTAAFAARPELRPLVDRYELWNRHERFDWVAEASLPPVANGDVHLREHVATWKTMLPCAKEERAVVEYLRSAGRVTFADLSGLSLAA
jgi:predicted metal-dependent phosphoesterase TrpH